MAETPDVGTLYRAHARPLYGFIYNKIGAREEAEDITSDVFIKALSHLDPARGDRSVVAWLYRVANNAVNDYWRGKVLRAVPLEEARLARQVAPAPDEWRRAQASARAHALLERLPDNYRTVLSCRLLEGLTVTETADRMGISPDNVKVLHHRALKRAASLPMREGASPSRTAREPSPERGRLPRHPHDAGTGETAALRHSTPLPFPEPCLSARRG